MLASVDFGPRTLVCPPSCSCCSWATLSRYPVGPAGIDGSELGGTLGVEPFMNFPQFQTPPPCGVEAHVRCYVEYGPTSGHAERAGPLLKFTFDGISPPESINLLRAFRVEDTRISLCSRAHETPPQGGGISNMCPNNACHIARILSKVTVMSGASRPIKFTYARDGRFADGPSTTHTRHG